MQAASITLNQLLILFLMGGTGYLVKKKNFITDQGVNSLTFVLLNISLPCMILNQLQVPYTAERLKTGLLTFFAMCIMMIFGYYFSKAFAGVLKIPPATKQIWAISAAMPNCIFIGLPIVTALYGQESAFYLCFIALGFNFITFSFIVGILGKSENSSFLKTLRGIFTNPVIISSLLGFVLFVAQITLPSFISSTAGYFGSMVTPISMIILGALVSKNSLSELFRDKLVYAHGLLNQIIKPLIFMVVLSFLIKDELARKTLTICYAMPIATSTSAIIELYTGNGAEAAKYCVVSTLFTIIVLPVFSAVIAMF